MYFFFFTTAISRRKGSQTRGEKIHVRVVTHQERSEKWVLLIHIQFSYILLGHKFVGALDFCWVLLIHIQFSYILLGHKFVGALDSPPPPPPPPPPCTANSHVHIFGKPHLHMHSCLHAFRHTPLLGQNNVAAFSQWQGFVRSVSGETAVVMAVERRPRVTVWTTPGWTKRWALSWMVWGRNGKMHPDQRTSL